MTASSGFLTGQIADLRKQLRQIIIDVSSKANSGANTDITSVYLSNTGLKIQDTDATHGLSIVPGSSLTADRILTLITGDSARTLTLSGNSTLSDWFNQSVKTTASPTFLTTTLSGLSAGYVPRLNSFKALTNSTIYEGSGPVATGVAIGGTDIRGILTVQVTSSATYATDADMSDAGRFFVMQNNSTSNAVNMFSNISLQVNPTGSLSGGRCLADIRLVRETANLSNSFFLFSGFRQGAIYRDFWKLAFDTSWTVSKFFIGGKTTATAIVHLAAGSASASSGPLKYTTGTLVTTPEAGLSEYNNSFYLTKSSGLRFGLGGVVADFTSDANNVGANETDLYIYTTPASTLAATGEKLSARFGGTFNDTTATVRIRAYFAGTSILDTGNITVTATGAWDVDILIIRTGTATARAVARLSTESASKTVYSAQTNLTNLTFTNINIFKITGQAGGAGGGNNDITAKLGSIRWEAAA